MKGHGAYRALEALDKLQGAQRYLQQQFRLEMNRDEAKANLESRALIFRKQNEFMRTFCLEITEEEFQQACKAEGGAQ